MECTIPNDEIHSRLRKYVSHAMLKDNDEDQVWHRKLSYPLSYPPAALRHTNGLDRTPPTSL